MQVWVSLQEASGAVLLNGGGRGQVGGGCMSLLLCASYAYLTRRLSAGNQGLEKVWDAGF